MVRYLLSDKVTLRSLNNEYLAFFSLSKETLILHYLAFQLLSALKHNSLDFAKILAELVINNRGITENELNTFVITTLQHFCKLGFIEESKD